MKNNNRKRLNLYTQGQRWAARVLLIVGLVSGPERVLAIGPGTVATCVFFGLLGLSAGDDSVLLEECANQLKKQKYQYLKDLMINIASETLFYDASPCIDSLELDCSDSSPVPGDPDSMCSNNCLDVINYRDRVYIRDLLNGDCHDVAKHKTLFIAIDCGVKDHHGHQRVHTLKMSYQEDKNAYSASLEMDVLCTCPNICS